MPRGKRILFLTSCPLIWGGSEELWSGAALRLKERGFEVLTGRSESWHGGRRHARWEALRSAGVGVNNFAVSGLGRAVPDAVKRFLPAFQRPVWRLRNLGLAAKIRLKSPDLVVISQGQAYDGCFPIGLPEACQSAGVPYVLICQKAAEIHWPDDALRQLYRRCYREAAAAYFVSEHNQRTVEQQLAMALPRSRVVRNPFMVRVTEPLPWPTASEDVCRLACVARIWPLEKAQDVILNVLALDKWRSRPIELSLFGEGPMAQGLREMAEWLGTDEPIGRPSARPRPSTCAPSTPPTPVPPSPISSSNCMPPSSRPDRFPTPQPSELRVAQRSDALSTGEPRVPIREICRC